MFNVVLGEKCCVSVLRFSDFLLGCRVSGVEEMLCEGFMEEAGQCSCFTGGSHRSADRLPVTTATALLLCLNLDQENLDALCSWTAAGEPQIPTHSIDGPTHFTSSQRLCGSDSVSF